MPLSQYIVQHLSEHNPLHSQEDKVKLLNEAEPILKQINAPRLSLMLRKKIAELAQVSDEEMQSLLRLSKPGNVTKKAIQRQSRSPLSLKKRFILMALMRPDLVIAEDLILVQNVTAEDQFLTEVLKICIANPTFKPATLLHTIKSVDEGLKAEVERELHLLDESLDFVLEFAGARTQLSEEVQERKITKLLNEKPPSAWTAEERELLKKLGIK